MGIAQRFTDRVHQRVVHDLHRQGYLGSAGHLDALFQAVAKAAARLIVRLLVIDVVACQLDHPNPHILRQLNSFTHNFQPLMPHRVVFTTQRKTAMGAKAHRRHPDAGFSHRLDQRQTLLRAPVQPRKAGVRFIERHLNEIKAQRFCKL